MKITKKTMDIVESSLLVFCVLEAIQNNAKAYWILVFLSMLLYNIITLGTEVYLDKKLYESDTNAKNGEIPKRLFGSFMCVMGQVCCFKLIEMTINIFKDTKFKSEYTNGWDTLALKMLLLTISLMGICFIIKYMIICISLFKGVLEKISH